ncbi:PucR family transcriptional regulator [Microbacterium azadirachtae]|uniref:Carbohydrate diacid transcriptional activator CdaR n=1 Tax=Microbacterium azadirachtae TaxID=582680 RepID=A0A0F0LNM0_9MICO|nr:PucR family transcriptional regulator [Microbacterium azadirachtae]KJL34733.1 carbohydrate diacid transcriptional activator CdaR [Microbacterium azadirachtae]
MTLEAQVQAYADRLGRPIIVFDAEFTVTAFSVHDGDVDHARLAIILAHRGSSRARESIKEFRVGQADGPVLIPAIEGGQTRLVAPIRHDGHLVGYVSSTIPDGHEPVADDEVLRTGREQLGVVLAAMALGNRQDEDRALRLLSALFGGTEHRARAADELLTSGLLSPAPHYTAISLTVAPGAAASVATLRLLLDRAVASIPVFPTLKAVGAVIDGEAVIAVPYEIDADRLTALLAQPAFSALRAGIGGAHAPLAAAFRSLREARIAQRAAVVDDDRGSVAHWADLGLDRVLLQLPLAELALTDLPEAVQRLLDAQSGPDLAHTLEAYLDCGCDAQRTAQELHVHRSTLYYRLDRIRAIADVDLADGGVRRELHTALRVATLAGLR